MSVSAQNRLPNRDIANIDRIGADAAFESNGNTLRSLPVVERGVSIKRLLSFVGPGYLIAVGYMDPGNWATDLAGGSAFGYSLLWVIALSNVMAIVLQILAARLGIASGLDLAQVCRLRYRRRWVIVQWSLCEIAICATDLAEVLGMAIALKLLFNLPLMSGVLFTTLDALLILWLQQRGFRYLEAFIIALLGLIGVCLGFTVAMAQPDWQAVADGFIPSAEIARNSEMLYLAIGIIGATVMPHNLYLHSSVVQTRRYTLTTSGRHNAIRFASIDIAIALMFAFVVNAAILIMSSAFFHGRGVGEVTEIHDAYQLLTPLTGSGVASFLFALALLASGQSSTVTATLAGQIVMEGYLSIRLPAWGRRLLTRLVAIIPAIMVTMIAGESGVSKLLILSQVILSLQLPFAMVPLIQATSDRKLMGPLASSRAVATMAWVIASVITSLNVALIVSVWL